MVWRSPDDDGFENKDLGTVAENYVKPDFATCFSAGTVIFCFIAMLVIIALIFVSCIKTFANPNGVPAKYEVEYNNVTYWSDDVVFNSDGSIWFKPIDSDEHIYIKNVYKVTIYDVEGE